MDTRVWGPHAWKLIHTVAFNYPEEPTSDDKKRYSNFFRSLADVLPCETCREHFGELLKQHPVEKANASRLSMSRWSVDAHNIVNRRLRKPVVPYEVARREYEAIRGKTCVKPKAERCAPLPKAIAPKCSGSSPVVIFLSVLLAVLVLSMAVTFVVCNKKTGTHR